MHQKPVRDLEGMSSIASIFAATFSFLGNYLGTPQSNPYAQALSKCICLLVFGGGEGLVTDSTKMSASPKQQHVCG